MSSRQARMKHSIAQDTVYIVSNGKVKTPKSLLLPSNIKLLTNSTKIINIVHRLGQCFLLNIKWDANWECIHRLWLTEKRWRYFTINQSKETFTIYVADNIDREEKTLSVKWICSNQFADQRFTFYLFIHLFAFEEKGLTAKQWKSIDPIILEFYWMLHFNQSNFSFIFKSIIISFTLGFGMIHRVNNLIIQGTFGEREFHGKVDSPKRKRNRRWFSQTSCAPEVNYRYNA